MDTEDATDDADDAATATAVLMQGLSSLARLALTPAPWRGVRFAYFVLTPCMDYRLSSQLDAF